MKIYENMSELVEEADAQQLADCTLQLWSSELACLLRPCLSELLEPLRGGARTRAQLRARLEQLPWAPQPSAAALLRCKLPHAQLSSQALEGLLNALRFGSPGREGRDTFGDYLSTLFWTVPGRVEASGPMRRGGCS